MQKGDYQTKEKAENYNLNRFKNGLFYVDSRERKILSEWIRQNNNTFLDLGSGTGRILKTLILKRPKIIYALDASSEMLAVLENNFEKEVRGKKIKTIKAKAHQTKLPNSSVNTITAFHLFKHLNNPSLVLREIRRILKPNGFLIADFLNSRSFISLNSKSCFTYTFKQIQSLLNNEGFVLKEAIFVNFFGETIYSFLGESLGKYFDYFDYQLSKSRLEFGTKIMILAQKRE